MSFPRFFALGEPIDQLPEDAAFADGALETMRLSFGQIPLWHFHRARLQRSGLPLRAALNQIESLLESQGRNLQAGVFRARLRVGYMAGKLHWDLALTELESPPEGGYSVTLFPVSVEFPELESVHTGCKWLDRNLYNEAAQAVPAGGVEQDGLLLDARGRVIETLRCNLLVRTANRWQTPCLREVGVQGVMRAWLAQQVDLQEADLHIEDLRHCSELAVCNSLRGVMPVTSVFGIQEFSVGDETRILQRLIAEKLW